MTLRVLCATTLLSVACGPAAEPTADSAEPVAAEHAEAEVHWSYAGETGPEHWASLSPGFAECEEGREQSPIDLRDPRVVEGPTSNASSGPRC